MQLENRFVVDAPLERTWSTLIDIRRVAQCLPGAKLEDDVGDGTYRGSMQVRLGPMSLKYTGSAKLADVDEAAHVATIEVQAKEQRGQGTATARIRNQLQPREGDATEVTVQTDLSITGRPAQFGRGIMEDVAGTMLEDFAKRLQNEVLGGNGGAPSAAAENASTPGPNGQAAASAAAGPEPTTASHGPPLTGAQPRSEPAALDLGPILMGPIGKRVAMAGGLLLVVLLLVRSLTGRRGRGVTVSASWR